MTALRSVLAAADVPPGVVEVLEESELGTLVSVGGETILVSPPYDPDGTGVVSVRAVGAPPPALPSRPQALVADLPSAEPVSLQTAEGMRAFAREFGRSLPPLTMIRLLVSQATPEGLPTLFEGDAQRALLDAAERDAARLEPPVVEPLADGGWSARFAAIVQHAEHGRPVRAVVHDWQAELTRDRGLIWWIAERSS